MTNTYIISGFLGAGKTTFIQKILAEAFEGQKVALIENDFGEISVDAALLKGQAAITEINSGCICCSLSGNFVSALQDLLERIAPEVILIEPSGVGKLSDIVSACESEELRDKINLAKKITIVDAKRGEMYLENFGEFFENQVQHADSIVFSHTQTADAAPLMTLLQEVNPEVEFINQPWENLDMLALLNMVQPRHEHVHANGEECSDEGCHCHEHAEGEHHHHNHAAEEVFETLSLQPQRVFTAQQLESKLESLQDKQRYGTILRAKGFVKTTNGMVAVQYVPAEYKLEKTAECPPLLNIIGSDLNLAEIEALFTV